jgi:hypothetical protein
MVDLDQIFQFATPKYVYLRDAKLGITKYTLMLLIFLYVVIYEILYTCDHLVPHHAQGFGQITMNHPVDDCDDLDRDCQNKFDNIVTLKYCKQYSPSESSLERKLKDDNSDKEEDGKEEDGKEEDGKDDAALGDSITVPQMCKYLDKHRLEWESSPPSEIFIPTFYRSIEQKLNDECYNPDDPPEEVTGRKKYRCKSAWETTAQNLYYIADIESYLLRLTHSFSSPTIGKFGVSEDFQGFFAACETNHPTDVKTDCKIMKVPHSTGRTAPEDEVGLTSAEEEGIPSLTVGPLGGDQIELGDLLKVTPVAQNHGIENILDAKLPADFGHPGKSLREAGGMLLVDVDYNNDGYLRPGIPGMGASFAIKPITYTYRPYFVPTSRNEKFQLVQQSDSAKTRTIDVWSGLTIKMQFNGQLVEFSWSKVLTALTSGLVLLSMASTLVMYLAAYVLPLKEKYSLLMYQMSEDFSDFAEMRREAKDFATLKSVFSPGTKLLSKLDDEGKVSAELSNEEIVKLLCVTEMRLNRLDGMDPRLVFETGTENNKINRAIGREEQEFYTKTGIKEPALSRMSFNGRINSGAKAVSSGPAE